MWDTTKVVSHTPEKPKANSKVGPYFTPAKVRASIDCTNCLKPRLIYVQHALKPTPKVVIDSIQRVKDDNSFECGQTLFEEGHVLLKVLRHYKTS